MIAADRDESARPVDPCARRDSNQETILPIPDLPLTGSRDLSRSDVIGFVMRNVQARNPCAVVRFGEGEGRLLVVREGDDDSFGVARRKIRRQSGLKLDNAGVREVKSFVDMAFDEADLVGIRGSDSFNPEHLMWVRRIEDVLDERLRHGRKPVYVGHCLLNTWLDEALGTILGGQERVSAVTCRNIQPLLASRFGVRDPKVYKIPSQFVVRGVDDAFEAELHDTPIYPRLIKDLEASLQVRHRGEIFLVGAGLFGKHLCIRIRERGGIALDLGSRLDSLVQKITRGPNKGMPSAVVRA